MKIFFTFHFSLFAFFRIFVLSKHNMTMQNPAPLPSLIQSQAAIYGKRAAMLYRDDELQKWKEISWKALPRP